MAYARRSYSETAVSTTISSGINDTVESFALVSSTGWPSGASGNFYARIGTETIECQSRSSLTVTVKSGGRGSLGTAAAAHTSGATVELVFTSGDADEANYAVSQTVGKVTTAGDQLVASGVNAFNRVAKGTNDQVWLMVAGSPAWGALATDSVGSAQIAADAVGSAEIANNAVGISEIANAARRKEIVFSKSGVLTTGAGTFRWYPPVNITLVNVWASVGTAPTGASLLVDVNRTGTTIFTTQGNRPTIAASTFYDLSGTADGTVTMTTGTDYLTVDIDQIGSTIAGSDLTVGVVYYET